MFAFRAFPSPFSKARTADLWHSSDSHSQQSSFFDTFCSVLIHALQDAPVAVYQRLHPYKITFLRKNPTLHTAVEVRAWRSLQASIFSKLAAVQQHFVSIHLLAFCGSRRWAGSSVGTWHRRLSSQCSHHWADRCRHNRKSLFIWQKNHFFFHLLSNFHALLWFLPGHHIFVGFLAFSTLKQQ